MADLDLEAQRIAQLPLQRRNIGIADRTRPRRAGRGGFSFFDQPFGLTNREVLRDDLFGQAFRIVAAQQGTGMAHAEFSRDEPAMDAQRQVPQPHQIGDMAPRLPDDPPQLFLAMAIILDQAAIGLALFPRVQLLALDILDQRNLERGAVIKSLDQNRHLMELSPLRCAPAALPGDNLIMPPKSRTTIG